MAKLVGVYHDDSDSGRAKSNCLARRQLPLVIESDLTMIMALDDACLACSSSTLTSNCNSAGAKKKNSSLNLSRESFLRKYDLLSLDEITAALMVTFEDIMSMLSKEISCVGCRRSVENLVQRLYKSGDSALEPLVITEDGIVSVSRDHILTPQALANLFCVQLPRLESTYMDSGHNSKSKKKSVRCSAHSLGLGLKRMINVGHWLDTWECMERECQEEVVLIHFDLLRSTLDHYLKKHSFCSECTNMVNKAYNLLIRVEGEDSESPEATTSSSSSSYCGSSCSDQDDDCKAEALYQGITACTADKHVHVDCSADFIAKLISMAEPELSGLRQERHAKTLEIAKKEVLTCIGICLHDRFQRIQQRLREGQQSCDILFLIALKSLKKSYEVAFESKQGISDLERLCQEFDEEERRKQEKAQKKRDNKKNKLMKKKKDKNENNIVEARPEAQKDTDVNQNDKSRRGSDPARGIISLSVAECCHPSGEGKEPERSEPVSISTLLTSSKDRKADKETSRLSCLSSASCRKTRLPATPSKDPFSILSLESMLDGLDEKDEEDEGAEEGIPLEEIKSFQARQSDVIQQREELRRNLRQRFAQLCGNGL